MSSPDLTPPPDRDLPAVEQRKAALVRELRASERPSRLRRRHVLLLPAGLLVTAGAAWAAGVFSTPVKDITTVDCRAGTQRGAPSARLPSFLKGQVSDNPTGVCLSLPNIAEGLGYVRDGQTRSLVSCRGERQAVVVPGDDAKKVCARIGLAALSAEDFRDEVQRQLKAFELVDALFPDPDEQPETGDAPDCIPAGALQKRGQDLLREHGFEDFRIRLHGGQAADCTDSVSTPIDSDGRTIRIITDGAEDSSARSDAKAILSEAPCRRLRREERLRTLSDEAVLAAVECVNADLFVRRGHGLRPTEARAVIADQLGLPDWRTIVRVSPGRGVRQFTYTAIDRRAHTIRVGFVLRRIVAPGARSPADR